MKPNSIRDGIVYKNDTFNLAAQWLGVNGKDEVKKLVAEAEGTMPKPRKEGLGLGGKFLSHKKDTLYNYRAEKLLRKRFQIPPQAIPQATKPHIECLSKAETRLKKNARLKKTDLIETKDKKRPRHH